MRLPPLLLVFINIFLMSFTRNFFHIYQSTNFYFFAVFLLTGLIINLISVLLFRKNKTTVNPLTLKSTKLVIEGLYRFTRNPMYVGMLFIQIAFVFLFNSYLAAIFPIIFFCYLNFIQIPEEEKILVEIFGDDYSNYMKKTRRWF